ncbi:hypothetical protein HDU83_005074 [Entophlyctis luteolus]|nr:hypothetical protein HDU83_005074 [Entophlyctis luteolus]
MNAAYAKHGVASNSTPTIQVPPNPILYVSIFPCFGEGELLEIFSAYEGFDSCRFFPMHALVRFVNLDTAKRALEDLNLTTNLFANYSTKSTKSIGDQKRLAARVNQDPVGLELAQSPVVTSKMQQNQHIPQQSIPQLQSPQQSSPTGSAISPGNQSTISSGQQANNASSPKCTIHVTNLDKDIPNLLSFFKTLPGFSRVAFYIDYAFVIFTHQDHAFNAIETILFGSRMKANFARSDYTPHIVPASALGAPSSVVRISDYPATTGEEDLRALLRGFAGVVGLSVFHSSCLVTFDSIDSAQALVDELNGCTNLTCVFGKRKGSVVGANSNLSVTSGAPSSAVGVVPGGFFASPDDNFSNQCTAADLSKSGTTNNMGGPSGFEKESGFDNGFPALNVSSSQVSVASSTSSSSLYMPPQQQQPQQLFVSQRSSLSSLDNERLALGANRAKLSVPPGFGNASSGNSFIQQQQQQSAPRQSVQGFNQQVHQSISATNILQPRATSFPSLPGFPNVYNSTFAVMNTTQIPSQLPSQQQLQQMPLTHDSHQLLSGHQQSPHILRHFGSTQSLHSTYSQSSNVFQGDFLASAEFTIADDFQAVFGPQSTPTPPPPVQSAFSNQSNVAQQQQGQIAFPKPGLISSKRQSLKPNAIGGFGSNSGSGLNTPPSTPFSRTSSPLHGANSSTSASALALGASNSNVDILTARLALLEAENTSLKYQHQPMQNSSAFWKDFDNNCAAAVESPLAAHSNVLDNSERSLIVRKLQVKVGLTKETSANANVADGATGSEESDSDATAAEENGTSSDGVDWKMSFEAAVDELMKMQQTHKALKAEYEKFQILHKNCGYLQGLLNICD